MVVVLPLGCYTQWKQQWERALWRRVTGQRQSISFVHRRSWVQSLAGRAGNVPCLNPWTIDVSSCIVDKAKLDVCGVTLYKVDSYVPFVFLLVKFSWHLLSHRGRQNSGLAEAFCLIPQGSFYDQPESYWLRLRWNVGEIQLLPGILVPLIRLRPHPG